MTDFQKNKEIIKLFIKDPKQVNWGQEISVCKKLFKSYPDLEFWKQIKLDFKLNSLAWFLTPQGKEFLVNSLTEMNKDFSELNNNLQNNLKKDIIVKDKDSVEDLFKSPEKKTLISWLNS